MAAKDRARKKEQTSATSGLIEAINFINLLKGKTDIMAHAHCYIENKTVSASNGNISLGCFVEESFTACPQTALLLAALKSCKEELSIGVLDNNALSIKSGAFRANVPCVNKDQLYIPEPDIQALEIDNKLLKCFEVLSPLADEKSQTVETGSILLKGGSAISTDSYVGMEYWHGFPLPDGIALPKAAISIILKSKKNLKGFGYDPQGKSVTFWFEDKSWIKTLLFDDEWSDLSELFNVQTNSYPIPDNFFEALRAIEPFGYDAAYFKKDKIQSSPVDNQGSSFEVPGIIEGHIFSIKKLLSIAEIAKKIDYTSHEFKLYFFGENVRGIVMARTI